jgi:hypothetical protein
MKQGSDATRRKKREAIHHFVYQLSNKNTSAQRVCGRPWHRFEALFFKTKSAA